MFKTEVTSNADIDSVPGLTRTTWVVNEPAMPVDVNSQGGLLNVDRQYIMHYLNEQVFDQLVRGTQHRRYVQHRF